VASEQQGLDPRYEATFQRGFEPEPEQEEGQKPRRNPWLVVLWVLGALMTVGGLAGLIRGLQADPNPTDVLEVVLPQVLLVVAPWLVGVGLATLAGAVFLHAVRWRP
jgi:hypothetical protein